MLYLSGDPTSSANYKCHTACTILAVLVYCKYYTRSVFPVLYFPGDNIAHKSKHTSVLSCYMASYNNHRVLPTILQYAGEEPVEQGYRTMFLPIP